jgi:hypothetical protein
MADRGRSAGSDRGRSTIDWALAFGYYASLPAAERSYRLVAERFDVSVRTVEKHGRKERWRDRLRRIQAEAAAEAERQLGRAWGEQIAQFTKLIEASMLTYAQQLRAGGVRITASEFVGLAKLVMQLHGDPTERIELVADSTEWQALRTRILDAVAEFPEARAALAEALEQGRDDS